MKNEKKENSSRFIMVFILLTATVVKDVEGALNLISEEVGAELTSEQIEKVAFGAVSWLLVTHAL